MTAEAESPTPSAAIDLVRRFIAVDQRKRELTGELDDVKAERAALAEQVTSVYLDNTVTSMRVDGCTVYLTETLWAKRGEDLDAPALCAALKESGLGDIVQDSYSSQSLSAWLREQPRDDDTGQPVVPDGLVGKLSASIVKDVRVKRS